MLSAAVLFVALAICGGGGMAASEDKTTRIFGGVDVKINQHPYLVSISDRMMYTCAGVIMSETWVMGLGDETAKVSRANMRIRAGSDYVTGGTEFRVDKIVRHPKFNKETLRYNYNFCLIKVIGTFTKGPTIGYASLPSGKLSAGTAVTAVGYGNPNVGGLRQATMTWLNLADCKKAHSSEVTFQSAEIGCAHNPGKTTLCSADVGVPLLKNGVLHGFFSKTITQDSCSASAKPVLVSEIFSELTWVKETISK